MMSGEQEEINDGKQAGALQAGGSRAGNGTQRRITGRQTHGRNATRDGGTPDASPKNRRLTSHGRPHVETKQHHPLKQIEEAVNVQQGVPTKDITAVII